MKMSLLSLTSAVLLVGAGAFATTAQAQQSFGYPQAYLGGDAMFWSLDPDRALPVMTWAYACVVALNLMTTLRWKGI